MSKKQNVKISPAFLSDDESIRKTVTARKIIKLLDGYSVDDCRHIFSACESTFSSTIIDSKKILKSFRQKAGFPDKNYRLGSFSSINFFSFEIWSPVFTKSTIPTTHPQEEH